MNQITGDPVWSHDAEHAREFVEAMWDTTNGCYLTGTDRRTANTRGMKPGQFPLDPQSWSALALTNALVLHPQLLSNAHLVHRCAFDGFSGYDFNDDRDGIWFEGTARDVRGLHRCRQQSAGLGHCKGSGGTRNKCRHPRAQELARE